MSNRLLNSQRGNYEVDVLQLAAQGAGTVQSVDFENLAGRGISIFINVTSVTGSLTVTLQGKDPVSGAVYTLIASPAIAAPGFSRMTVFPGAPVAANVSANDQMPKTWNVKAVVATGPCTATISATITGGNF